MISKSQITCSSCNREKNTDKYGICRIRKGSDGLPIMCSGSWTYEKYYYLTKYLDIFMGIKNKWGGNIYYIDLFSGPGKCMLRETEKEVDGSPLIALNYDFAGYVFVDIYPENIKTLKKRCSKISTTKEIVFIPEDCNKIIGQVKKFIPKRSLSVALIDPTGLQFKFSSYEKLTKNRKIDLIINFPLGTAIKRNYSKPKSKKLDRFLGGSDWRKSHIANPTSYFIDYYKSNLKKLGYQIPEEKRLSGEITIKTMKTRVPLYHLLFSSKHTLGETFWKEISKIKPSGQLPLL